MFLQEARDRWFWYPPPYWYQNQWWWATPWLWFDGDPHCESYSTWQYKIEQRLDVRTPVTISMWGDWWPAQGTGTIYAKFRTDSTTALDGRVLFVVTEDSIYKIVNNGDQWHNNVARDYIDGHLGTIVNIPAGDSITLSRPFTLDTLWNPDMIQFVTWIQDLDMTTDSIIEIWQGGILDIEELGIKELENNQIATANVSPIPNPAVNGTRLSFTLPTGEDYRVAFYDISGRKIRTFSGFASGNEESIEWNLRDEQGTRVSAGVYLYRFESKTVNASGKIIVR
jgi:hypothetical protein